MKRHTYRLVLNNYKKQEMTRMKHGIFGGGVELQNFQEVPATK